MLDAEPRDLGVDRGGDLLLRRFDFGALLLRRADDVEGAPGQHASDRIEVGGVNVAADPRRLEWDRPAAAERVRDLRPMAEARDAQLLDEFRQRLRAFVPRWRFTSAQIGASSSASSHSSGRRTIFTRSA